MEQSSKPRTALAVTSLVLGVVSVPCLGLGLLPGISAIITGHLARRRVRRDPVTHGGTRMALAGLILGYLSLVQVLLVVLALLGGFKSARQSGACLNNLRQIGMAVRLYAEVNQGRYPQATPEFGPHLGYSTLLVCPLDTSLAKRSIPTKDFSRTSYTLTLEGASEATPDKVIARCPIHGYTLKANGAVDAVAQGVQVTTPAP